MLKTTKNTRFAANFKETDGKVDGNSVVGDIVDGGEATKHTKRKNKKN